MYIRTPISNNPYFFQFVARNKKTDQVNCIIFPDIFYMVRLAKMKIINKIRLLLTF